jgi:tetratricopeptide (TPR) repeat protein
VLFRSRALRRALDIRRESEDRRAAAQSALALARIGLDAHESDRLVEEVEAFAEEFADLPSDASALALRGQVARAHFLMGHDRAAIAKADEVLEAAERLDVIPVVADTLVTRGSALIGIGRAYEGLGALEAGMRLADERGLPNVALRARINYGFFQNFREPAKALPVLRDGLRVAMRLGDRSNAVTMTANLSGAAFFLGQSELALSEIDALLALDPGPVSRLWLLGNAMFHWTLRGDPVEATLAELERGAQDVSDPQFVAFYQEIRAYRAFVDGDHRGARALCRAVAATTVARAPSNLGHAARYALFDSDAPGVRADIEALAALRNHGPAIEIRAREAEAGLAALEGRTASLSLYRSVIERWDALGMVVDSATTALEMVTLLGPADPQVRAVAEVARHTFARIGARPLLARMDEALRPGEERSPVAVEDGGISAARAAAPVDGRPGQ